jgi:hypothetical protein
MKITELIVESQQLDEGPFTQAIGKVGGKIAKGAAAIGKDLKTGFKAGYSGEQPPADADATTAPADAADATTKPAAAAAPTTQAAPVKKAAPVATTTEPAAAPAEEPVAAPAKEPAQGGEDVGKLQQQIKSLTSDVQNMAATMNADRRDIITDISNLKQQVAKLVQPSQAEIDADRARLGVGGSESVARTGNSLAETLARKVQEQKQRMFETALMSGTQSVFKK